jgi:flavin prenyltransferase
MNKKKIVVAVTGASGSVYAELLLKKLKQLDKQLENCSVVLSDNARDVWEFELSNSSYNETSFKVYKNSDLFASMASGSSGFDTMIICPCSMGTLGRIASGVSTDLISRAADVMLKERRKLILVTREMPLSLIHIRNMQIVTEAGGIVCPASPSFYSKPETLEATLETVVDKVLSLAGFEIKGFKWGENF